MDLKEFGIEELTHEEATDIDGGALISKMIAAIIKIPFLFLRRGNDDSSIEGSCSTGSCSTCGCCSSN